MEQKKIKALKIGYARVSTEEQSLDLQIDALKEAGCEKIYQDVVSGAKSERRGLQEALDFLREGDTLVVWKLDRLGRSLKHLIGIITDLRDKGVDFCSLQESIDTSTTSGLLVFHIFGALSQFERELISERTQAGLRSARARGRLGGRPKKLSNDKIKLAKTLYDSEKHTVTEICKRLDISRTTFYRNVINNEKNNDLDNFSFSADR